MGFGERLKFAREARKMSGETLGKAVGVTRATISHWEVNRYVPDLRQLVMLSKEVHVNLHWLATGDVGTLLSEEEHKLIQSYQLSSHGPATPPPAPPSGPSQTVASINPQELSWKRRQTGKDRQAQEKPPMTPARRGRK